MRRSTDRILTTHAGSLPRPTDLREMWSKHMSGVQDEALLQARLRSAVGEIVLVQVQGGVDIPNDGEFGKPMRAISDRSAWGNYIFERVFGDALIDQIPVAGRGPITCSPLDKTSPLS